MILKIIYWLDQYDLFSKLISKHYCTLCGGLKGFRCQKRK